MITETRGNPLAILEAVSTLTLAERRGQAPIAHPLAVGVALERAFAQQLESLPESTRTALLIAAASDTGSAGEIGAALREVGIDAAALEPAERAGVINRGADRIDFRHPLVRSAAYHLHDPTARRAAHRALAAAVGVGDRGAWRSSPWPGARARRPLCRSGCPPCLNSSCAAAASQPRSPRLPSRFSWRPIPARRRSSPTHA